MVWWHPSDSKEVRCKDLSTVKGSFPSSDRNLELVTIIECVCADGTNLFPAFVFTGKEFAQEWFEVDCNIGCVEVLS
jgi:hypothetical protein